jgi:hypothetical protein
MAVSSVLNAANTNDPIRAEKNPSTSTPRARGAMTRNGQHLQDEDEDRQQHQRSRGDERQQHRTDRRVEESHQHDGDDRLADCPDRDPGRSHAVNRKETVDTSRVITRRLMSAHGPPRHSHRMRACVA